MKTLQGFLTESIELEKFGQEAFDKLIDVIDSKLNLNQPTAQQIMDIILPVKKKLSPELINAGFTLREDDPDYAFKAQTWWKTCSGRDNYKGSEYIEVLYKDHRMFIVVDEANDNGNVKELVDNLKWWAWFLICDSDNNGHPGHCFSSKRKDATHNGTRKDYFA